MNDRFSRLLQRFVLSPFAAAAAILALNIYIAHDLFGREFSVQMPSIESVYIAISRWAMSNWHDLTWSPLWYTGQPFFNIYQPGLHLTVAAVATYLNMTPQHAYHLLTGMAYCAGPVALFALCYARTKRTEIAFISAAVYSLVASTCFFSLLNRNDAGGWLGPRRYQILIQYGEGPHTTAVAMIPLAILALHAAVYFRQRIWVALTPLILAAIVLTNWPGSLGLGMAILGYLIAHIGAERRTNWLALMGISVVGYAIASPWIPPSTVAFIFSGAQQTDGTSLGMHQALPALLVVLLLAGAHFLFKKYDVDRTLRFFICFAIITGAVAIGPERLGWRLLPQGGRFQLEFDMAMAGVLGWMIARGLWKIPVRVRYALMAMLLVGAGMQTRAYRRYALAQTAPIDIASTVEYRMAKAFEANFHDQRVYAPGNVSFWMNLFTDTPQVAGCCDQGVPAYELRVATYVINSGEGTGNHDTEYSLLWLRAYGANAVGVTGPNSTEPYKPFRNWRKFEGVLPEIWREGENVIYQIPRKSPELVRVIPGTSLLAAPPANGIDVAGLQPFVAALENSAAPEARLLWLNRHEAAIEASVNSGDVVYIQIAYNKGWRAEQNGKPLAISVDPLGLMYVRPEGTGPVRLRLVFGGTSETTLTAGFEIFGLLSVAGLLISCFTHRSKTAAHQR